MQQAAEKVDETGLKISKTTKIVGTYSAFNYNWQNISKAYEIKT